MYDDWGSKEVFLKHEQIFKALCVPKGYLYVGSTGTGHFVKMVHNGIEYGMMQALAEGFQVIHDSEYQFKLESLKEIAKLWNNGSVIRSWLVELCASVFSNEQKFEQTASEVNSMGEGLWTVQTALNQNTPVPVIAAALMVRQSSKHPDLFANKTLARLRQLFGGHSIKIKPK